MTAIPNTGNFSEAFAASTGGAAIVGKDGDLGFIWTSATGTVSLGDLPGGLNSSRGNAISADGAIVVGSSVYTGTTTEAFRWTAATGMTGIGDLPGGATASRATGISADGLVIAGTGTSASGEEAFRWTAAGMVGLGDLPGSTTLSEATAISADGLVIVGRSPSSTGNEAFRWTAETGMVGLGVWPGSGNAVSRALDVNADGSVIVGNAITGGTEAVVWRGAGGIERLWDVLISTGVNPAADGWTLLQSANGVSDDGLTIVGTGVRNGETVGFVAVVPEPGAAGVLALSAGGLLLRRARQG
jgi:probable HAF family extracellular repeat protein